MGSVCRNSASPSQRTPFKRRPIRSQFHTFVSRLIRSPNQRNGTSSSTERNVMMEILELLMPMSPRYLAKKDE